MTANKQKDLITEVVFTHNAIKALRDTTKSRGIHGVFSGFNVAFKDYFGQDPVVATTKMVKDGTLCIKPVKRGVMLYLPNDCPSYNIIGKRDDTQVIADKPKSVKAKAKAKPMSKTLATILS